MTIEAVIDLIEMGAVAPQDIVKCLRSALRDTPQRAWVGLTNDDWDEIFGNALTIGEAIKVTEAKLKAKNFA